MAGGLPPIGPPSNTAGTTHSPRIPKPKSETTFREGFYHNLPVGLHHLHHHLGHGGVAHPFFSPMAAKVTKRLWEIGDIVGVLKREVAQARRSYLGGRPWNGLAGKHR